MSLSRKHFRAMAEIINDSHGTDKEKRHTAACFAKLAQNMNHRFNRPKFMSACGLCELEEKKS